MNRPNNHEEHKRNLAHQFVKTSLSQPATIIVKEIDDHEANNEEEIAAEERQKLSFSSLNKEYKSENSYSVKRKISEPKMDVNDGSATARTNQNNDKDPESLLSLVEEIYTSFSGDDSEESRRIKSRLYHMKKLLTEEMKKSGIELQFIKGQLERRTTLLDKQRGAFLKELTMLREELFLKKRDPNHNPHDVMLFPWYNKVIKDIEVLDGTDLSGYEEENFSLFSLRTQTLKVAETLNNLKALEQQKLAEIEALQKSRLEAEALKNNLLTKSRRSPTPVPRSVVPALKSIAKSSKVVEATRQEDHSTSMMEDDSIEYFVDSDDSVSELRENADKHLRAQSSQSFSHVEQLDDDTDNEDDRYFSEAIQPSMKSNLDISDHSDHKEEFVNSLSDQNFVELDVQRLSGLLKEAELEDSEAERTDEENLIQLEGQISSFHHRFKDLFSEMGQLKQRLNFYQEEGLLREQKEGKGPEGQVTLVFTDVQDSTRLWELDLDCMCQCIKIHNQVMRTTIEQTNGFEVKTEGDAFMCAFTSVDDGVEFALRAQIALLGAEWPERLLEFKEGGVEHDDDGILVFRGLRVRMGIHTGFPIVQPDPVTGRADYFGPVVNRAARVEGQAAGGQIIISSSVWAEIMDKLDHYSVPVWTKFIGSVSLKGMDEPETIRLMLPFSLRNRLFTKSNPKTEDSSISKLEAKVKNLQNMHVKLEEEREVIQNQIQYKLKVKTLEDSMSEKDNIIKYLRGKLQSVKKNYSEAIKERDEKQKQKLSDHMKKLQEDIDVVMRKYTTMKQQYRIMKQSYEEVGKMFNKKIKFELQSFKKDLNMMDVEVKKSKRLALESQLKGWEQEKSNYVKQIENREKIIQEKDKRILQLRSEIELAKVNQKMERVKTVLKRDVPRSVVGGRKGAPVGMTHLTTPDLSDSSPTDHSPIRYHSKLLPNPNNFPNHPSYINQYFNPVSDIIRKTGIELDEKTPSDAEKTKFHRAESISNENTYEGDTTPIKHPIDSISPFSSPQYHSDYSPFPMGNESIASENKILSSGFNSFELTPSPDNPQKTKTVHFRGLNKDGVPVFIDNNGRLVSPRSPDQVSHHNLSPIKNEGAQGRHMTQQASPLSSTGQRVAETPPETKPSERSSTSTNSYEVPALDTTITVSDITHIMKQAIQDAVRTAKQYSNFDWNVFIQGHRIRDVDKVNVIPHSYLRKTDLNNTAPVISPRKNFKVWDNNQNLSFNITADDLRRWGMQHASQLIRPKLSTTLISKSASTPTEKAIQKKSYSRMLEHLGDNMMVALPSASVSHDEGRVDSEDVYIYQWDPLGTPFRRVKRSKSATPHIVPDTSSTPRRSTNTADGTSRRITRTTLDGHLVKDKRITLPDISTTTHKQQQSTQQTPQQSSKKPPKVHFGDLSKDERREQILQMLYYDRNATHFAHTSSPDNPLNNSSPIHVSLLGKHTGEVR